MRRIVHAAFAVVAAASSGTTSSVGLAHVESATSRLVAIPAEDRGGAAGVEEPEQAHERPTVPAAASAAEHEFLADVERLFAGTWGRR